MRYCGDPTLFVTKKPSTAAAEPAHHVHPPTPGDTNYEEFGEDQQWDRKAGNSLGMPPPRLSDP